MAAFPDIGCTVTIDPPRQQVILTGRAALFVQPVFRITIRWPDERETSEVTDCPHAAMNRVAFLSRPVSTWMVAFRGHTDDLVKICGRWYRCLELTMDGNHEPSARKAGGDVVLIEGMDADTVLNRYWSDGFLPLPTSR